MCEGISRVIGSHISLGSILLYAGCFGLSVFIYISLLHPYKSMKFVRPKYGVEVRNSTFDYVEIDVRNYESQSGREINNTTGNPKQLTKNLNENRVEIKSTIISAKTESEWRKVQEERKTYGSV